MNTPPLTRCPQCQSSCGPIACRMTGLKHADVVPLPGQPWYGPDAYTEVASDPAPTYWDDKAKDRREEFREQDDIDRQRAYPERGPR